MGPDPSTHYFGQFHDVLFCLSLLLGIILRDKLALLLLGDRLPTELSNVVDKMFRV